MMCKNGPCRNSGRVYAYALGSRRTVLCDDCLAALNAIGMAFRLIEDVRDERPVWLRRGHLGRDETGRLVA